MKNDLSPEPKQIKALRKRHRITQKELAESLYGVKEAQVANWEAGRRNCQPITWWAMVLTWDHIDIYSEPDWEEKV